MTMATKKAPIKEAPEFALSVHELAKLLAKDFAVPPGRYQFGIEFKIAVGAFGKGPADQPGEVLPAAAVGVSGVNIRRVADDFEGAVVIDVGSEESPAAVKPPAAKKSAPRKSAKKAAD